jgi:hypothetical protein
VTLQPGQRIEIVFKKDGTVQMESIGFKGAQCSAATKALRELLGTVKSDQPTPEFYQTEDEEHVRINNS